MADAHIGDRGVAEVQMTDAQGNVTTNYDEVSGVQYTSTNEAAVAVVDPDANPLDAELDFLALTTEPVFIDVTFDGRRGPDVNQVHMRSEEINVVPGEAVAGTVTVRFVQV